MGVIGGLVYLLGLRMLALSMPLRIAAAILIDATLIRAILLPASMALLDDWNWLLPRWLQWLPNSTTTTHAHETNR